MRLKSILIRLLIPLSAIASMINLSSAQAQPVYQWAPDQRVPGYLEDTSTPYLIADQDRTVHAFANQWINDGQDRRLAIVYRKWSLAGGWTRPVDVLLTPTGNSQIFGAFLDSRGIMHVVFMAGSNIYYSNAQASGASDVSAWSLPELVGAGAIDPSYGAIAGDNKGNLVIVYNGRMDGTGVYSITSNDAGDTWTEPVSIFLIHEPQIAPYFLNAYMGPSGKLHVVWSNVENSAAGQSFVSLYYDRLDVDSGQWSKPVLLEEIPEIQGYYGPSVPSIVDNGKYVVVMYNGGNPYTDQPVPFGRPTLRVQMSVDGGQTWQVATNLYPLLVGQSGEHSLVIDSSQNVHAIAIMRVDRAVDGEYNPIGGVWHLELRNNLWRNPERFVVSINPVNLRAVVSQGNVILATWIADAGDPGSGRRGVWYSYTLLDSPELPIVPLPTPSVQATTIPSSINTSPVSTSIPEHKPLLIDQSRTPYAVAQPILCGIVPVILLVLGVMTAIRRRDSHKS